MPNGVEYKSLIFNDDFSGNRLNTSKWELCPEWSRQGGACTWKNSMTSVSGGNLVLSINKDPLNPRKTIAGAVRTSGRFSNSFGYYEARIKFPTMKGSWGAFWIMAGDVNKVDNSGRDGSEIDIIETIDNIKTKSNHAVHWDGYDSGHKSQGKILNENIYDGNFHTFGFLWTNSKYVFYIDDKITWETTAGGVCQNPGYMKLTVESAFWNGSDASDAMANLPQKMFVDYVKVYSLK
ncbi:MAG: glycoside hydrolase family 16 protein [Clostridia bacterium]